MSPSRIPRPGGGIDPRSPSSGNGSVIRSAPASPAIGIPPPSHKPNNPFAQKQLQSPSPSHSHPTNNQTLSPGPARIPQAKRRVKPPSEYDDGDTHPPSSMVSGFRRPGPGIGAGSPEPSQQSQSGVSRLGARNQPSQPGPGSGQQRVMRQPSTPNLLVRNPNAINRPGPQTEPPNLTRARAASSAATTSSPIPRTSPLLFEPSFAESREPSVPPHIRIRLRLIHQLGVVLGIDAQGISSKIDIPGLLARVDAAYDKGYGSGLGPGQGNAKSASANGAVSGLPLPIATGGVGGLDVRESKGNKGKEHGHGNGMMGVFKRFGRKSVPEDVARSGSGSGAVAMGHTGSGSDGPAFGVILSEAPPGSWCTSLIGGQKHDLPLIVFTVVEEIYRRGMSQPGIFRLAGDGTRISHLTKVYNLPPLYGDSLPISNEPIHNLTGLIKRFVRDLPEPILDESLFSAFASFCAESEQPLSTRIQAAQIMLKLLPPAHFSLLIYLLAFLGQLPLFPDNRLNVESISIIFGPAICAARGKGISGLGPSTSGQRGVEHDPDSISMLVNQSQATLGWLLRNWSAISEKVLDPPDDGEGERGKEENGGKKVDPRLLSPIDLRGGLPRETPYRDPKQAAPSSALTNQDKLQPIELARDTSSGSEESTTSDTATTSSPPCTTPSPSSVGMPVSPSTGSMFARAFSSMSISSQAEGSPAENKQPKRSASFTSLSSLVKKGGGYLRMEKNQSISISRNNSADQRPQRPLEVTHQNPVVNPQITSVLGSLHDLLVSKDKQIERDARELALLRHTLLEMDEKLQRAITTSPATNTQTPAITITSTPSVTTLATKDRELVDVQSQLGTALAALETARVRSRDQATKILELEARVARAESEKRLEMGKLEVALALEQARVVGLIEERDLARDRLDKVKTTLFSVA